MPVIMKHTSPLWCVWRIEERSDELLSLLGNKDYLCGLSAMRTEKRQQEWLASRTALKEILGQEALIHYRENGAPFLEDKTSALSISHTKGYAAVLLSEQAVAGIDIEYRSDRVLKIRSRFMSTEEEAGIDKFHEVEHLLIHWCAKEALFKMMGQEDVDFVRHLHVLPFPYNETGYFKVRESCTPEGASYILNYLVKPDFILVWSL